MSNELDKAVEKLQGELAAKLKEAEAIKKAINQICLVSGKPLLYAEEAEENVGGVPVIKSDQFYRKPLATAVREFLEMKGSSAPVEEIYDALKRGGYDFGTGNEEHHTRNLRISFGKNPLFTYVKSNNTYGLAKKYGIRKKNAAADEASAEPEEVAEEVAEEEAVKASSGGKDKKKR